ncbi:MAG: hypothetical protein NTZ64_18050 [Polaromonas sp.]|nr:hypothetical protein [Polaromonas sp.]
MRTSPPSTGSSPKTQTLAQAAQTLSAQEAEQKNLAAESAQWVDAPLIADDDAGFDAATFEREFVQAQTSTKKD